MSIELCVLASGSSGNCSAVRTPAGVMLVDAGIGPRTAGERMNGTGLSLNDVRAICLTHLDRDHFNPNWLATIVRNRVRVFCAAPRVQVLHRMAQGELSEALGALVTPFDAAVGAPRAGTPFDVFPGLTLHPIALAHDEHGSHGFVLNGFGCRVGYATDLGRVPPHLIEQFRDLDLLAIESNYDPQMQLASPRPYFLKQRIMGGRGHLSNEQAYDAIRAVLDRAARERTRVPSHIVLLHRSRQCNCPNVVRRLFSRDERIARRLVLAEQYEPTPWLRPRPDAKPLVGEQLGLAFA